jgi:CopG family transcriptional regulator, nickel-responsive regulator
MKKRTAKSDKSTMERETLQRFGVSMDEELLKKFDEMISQRGYLSRSEAFRDLVRESLEEEVLTDEHAEAVGTISLVYNHHARNLNAKLTAAQHQALDLIASNLHIHLDEERCLEVLVVRGAYQRVRELADTLISIKGVKHGKFVTTADTSAGPQGQAHSHTHSHLKRQSSKPRPSTRQKAGGNKDN